MTPLAELTTPSVMTPVTPAELEAQSIQLAYKLQQEEHAHYGGAPSSEDVSGAPWPKELTWYELQHEPNKCGNFDVCSNGTSFFACVTRHNGQQYRDHTAHGLEPRPMPGQRLTIKYLPHNELGGELAGIAAEAARGESTVMDSGRTCCCRRAGSR